jgi:hypothetical protein
MLTISSGSIPAAYDSPLTGFDAFMLSAPSLL